MILPVEQLRGKFPAHAAHPDLVFFDNAAGTQICRAALDAMRDHLVLRNAIPGSPCRLSQDTETMLAEARRRVAGFVHAAGPEEIALGPNATALFARLAELVGMDLGRPRIVLSEIDHLANLDPWLSLRATGAEILWWKARPDGTLDTADLLPLLDERVCLVACTAASNATGARVDIGAVAAAARAVGAATVFDCVHLAPHDVIDVTRTGADHVICSGHKIFGPHAAFIWNRAERLDRLVRLAGGDPDLPWRVFERGTPAFENMAGMAAALAYVEDLAEGGSSAMARIRAQEAVLSDAMIRALEGAGATIHGPPRTPGDGGLPTFGFSLPGLTPEDGAGRLARAGLTLRSGNMHSHRLMRVLGLDPQEGLLRASLCHLNTPDEVERFSLALREILA